MTRTRPRTLLRTSRAAASIVGVAITGSMLLIPMACSRAESKPETKPATSPPAAAGSGTPAAWSTPDLPAHYKRLDSDQRSLIDKTKDQPTREAYVRGWALLNAKTQDTTLSDPLIASIAAAQPQGPKVRDTVAGYFDAGRVSFTLAALAQAWAKGTLPPDHRGILAAEAARLSSDSDDLIQLQCASILWALQNFPTSSSLGDAESKAYSRLISNEMLQKNLEAQQEVLRQAHAASSRPGG